jgi:hypothetical protein
MKTYLDRVTHLAAVAALDLGPVLGLGAVLGEVTNLLAVAAEDVVGVARLVAFLGNVVGRAAVAAGTSSDVRALSRAVNRAWRDSEGWLGTHILGKMASLVALAALHTLSRARLGALLGVVALLLAVLAGVRVDALLRTVASTVTDLLAVDAGDLGLVVLALGLLLLAVLLVC